MKHQAAQFRETTVFDWDMEPAEDRPSSFFTTADYSVRRPAHRAPAKSTAWVLTGATLLGFGVVGVLVMTHLLHG